MPMRLAWWSRPSTSALSEVSLVIQDDGCGLPEGFELVVVPRGDHVSGAWLPYFARRNAKAATWRSVPGEDGGTTVRITLPLESRT